MRALWSVQSIQQYRHDAFKQFGSAGGIQMDGVVKIAALEFAGVTEIHIVNGAISERAGQPLAKPRVESRWQ